MGEGMFGGGNKGVSGGVSAESYVVIEEMLAKQERQGGVVYGLHGTSGRRARGIRRDGFKDSGDIEGGYGVYFWDDRVGYNAVLPAERVADEDKDPECGLILVSTKNARPDFSMGRPQWLAKAANVQIVGMRFYKKGERPTNNEIDGWVRGKIEKVQALGH